MPAASLSKARASTIRSSRLDLAYANRRTGAPSSIWAVEAHHIETNGAGRKPALFADATARLTARPSPPRVRKNQGRDAMKFYNSVGPNPRVVRMFMAEKGISIPTQDVDLMKGENRAGDHLKRNPHGQMPTLELDNGAFLAEITAICEYLEDKNPKPALIGTTPEEKADTR